VNQATRKAAHQMGLVDARRRPCSVSTCDGTVGEGRRPEPGCSCGRASARGYGKSSAVVARTRLQERGNARHETATEKHRYTRSTAGCSRSVAPLKTAKRQVTVRTKCGEPRLHVEPPVSACSRIHSMPSESAASAALRQVHAWRSRSIAARAEDGKTASHSSDEMWRASSARGASKLARCQWHPNRAAVGATGQWHRATTWVVDALSVRHLSHDAVRCGIGDASASSGQDQGRIGSARPICH